MKSSTKSSTKCNWCAWTHSAPPKSTFFRGLLKEAEFLSLQIRMPAHPLWTCTSVCRRVCVCVHARAVGENQHLHEFISQMSVSRYLSFACERQEKPECVLLIFYMSDEVSASLFMVCVVSVCGESTVWLTLHEKTRITPNIYSCWERCFPCLFIPFLSLFLTHAFSYNIVISFS